MTSFHLYIQIKTNMDKNDKTIILRISDNLKKEYEDILNENGMNLSKRIKLLIKDDIKKLKKL